MWSPEFQSPACMLKVYHTGNLSAGEVERGRSLRFTDKLVEFSMRAPGSLRDAVSKTNMYSHWRRALCVFTKPQGIVYIQIKLSERLV